MKPEEMRVEIAKVRGWRCEKRVPFDLRPNAILCWIPPGGEEWQTQELPDYLNNLNECHQLMQWAGGNLMDADQWEEFGKNLLKLHPSSTLLDTNGKLDFYDVATFVSDLTSHQICEAFLKTLNLWKE